MEIKDPESPRKNFLDSNLSKEEYIIEEMSNPSHLYIYSKKENYKCDFKEVALHKKEDFKGKENMENVKHPEDPNRFAYVRKFEDGVEEFLSGCKQCQLSPTCIGRAVAEEFPDSLEKEYLDFPI